MFISMTLAISPGPHVCFGLNKIIQISIWFSGCHVLSTNLVDVTMPNLKCTVWTNKYTVHALADLLESQCLWNLSQKVASYSYPIHSIPFYTDIKKTVIQLTLGIAPIISMVKLTKRKSLRVLSTRASPRILLQEAINRVWELEKSKKCLNAWQHQS